MFIYQPELLNSNHLILTYIYCNKIIEIRPLLFNLCSLPESCDFELSQIILLTSFRDPSECLLQVKFSEMTLDQFRMLQTLEREPQEELTNQIFDASPAPGRQPFENGSGGNRRENPHKHLLYKPTFSQLNSYLASSFRELAPNGALLLYISADGDRGVPSKHADDCELHEKRVEQFLFRRSLK